MTRKLSALLAVAAVLLLSAPLAAHHAWRGIDRGRLTTVTGVVTSFDFSNPHVWIEFDVQGANGSLEKWRAGGPGPGRLLRNGWSRETLKAGDTFTAIGNRATDGSTWMRLERIALADGRELRAYGRG